MVAGVMAVLFGTILAFVGPLIIDDQIVKVSRRPTHARHGVFPKQAVT